MLHSSPRSRKTTAIAVERITPRRYQRIGEIAWNLDTHTANWKVIALVSGDIEALSGQAAQERPGPHEWIVWQGEAADKAEALQSAEKADPRVDLEWMRIR